MNNGSSSSNQVFMLNICLVLDTESCSLPQRGNGCSIQCALISYEILCFNDCYKLKFCTYADVFGQSFSRRVPRPGLAPCWVNLSSGQLIKSCELCVKLTESCTMNCVSVYIYICKYMVGLTVSVHYWANKPVFFNMMISFAILIKLSVSMLFVVSAHISASL